MIKCVAQSDQRHHFCLIKLWFKRLFLFRNSKSRWRFRIIFKRNIFKNKLDFFSPMNFCLLFWCVWTRLLHIWFRPGCCLAFWQSAKQAATLEKNFFILARHEIYQTWLHARLLLKITWFLDSRISDVHLLSLDPPWFCAIKFYVCELEKGVFTISSAGFSSNGSIGRTLWEIASNRFLGQFPHKAPRGQKPNNVHFFCHALRFHDYCVWSEGYLAVFKVTKACDWLDKSCTNSLTIIRQTWKSNDLFESTWPYFDGLFPQSSVKIAIKLSYEKIQLTSIQVQSLDWSHLLTGAPATPVTLKSAK